MENTIEIRTFDRTKLRKLILAEYVETLVSKGYDITSVIGKQLSYFDYIGIAQEIIRLNELNPNSDLAASLREEGRRANQSFK